jgi:hypothetical protein
MERERFLDVARETTLTGQQAEAFWHRHDAGHDRQMAAAAMDCSPSNVDHHERQAREKIITASNTMTLAGAVDADPDEWGAPLGTCARCGEPASTLKPDPRDTGKPIEETRQVCPACFAANAG